MTPERRRQIEELFEAAKQLEPSRRKPFLAEACANDNELRHEVESLLACDRQGEHFLEVPAFGMVGGSFDDETDSMKTLPLQQSSEPAKLALGEQLGHYRIIAPLGAGGMGEVYSATDMRLDRIVAIKLVTHEFAHDVQALKRFQREARAVSSLSHPNICTLYDVGELEGRPFLVMELLEGKSLKERLANGPLPLADVLALGVQITDALETAHSKGIVHRDIKPANIFITLRGEAKILDFGLAKFLSEPTESNLSMAGSAMGTIGYMSPEQALGELVDQRSDLFSLGITLYQMATGELPFRGRTPARLLEAIRAGRRVRPRTGKPALPAELERIILKALNADMTARYQRASQLKADLERLRSTANRRIRRVPAGAVAFGMVTLLAGAWIFLAPSRSPPAPRVRPLTSFPGIEQFPAFSPDGRHLVFLWDGERQDKFDLYRMPVDGGSPERLTNDADSECHPAWSPDGRTIAFFRCSPGTSDGMRQATTQVWLLDIATRKKRRVGSVYSTIDPSVVQLGWTADSRRLIVEDRSSLQDLSGLVLLDVEGGEKRRITIPPPQVLADRSPAVSPDGRTLAFCRMVEFGVGNIYLMALGHDGLPESQPQLLTRGLDDITDIMWSGDGREIVYASDNKGMRGLWRISASPGQRPRAIPSLARIGVHLALSPNGHLAYTEGYPDNDIWKLDLTDQRDKRGRLLISSGQLDQNPDISRDGRKVVFDAGAPEDRQIWVCDRDGSHLRRVASLGHQGGTPRWSPDGTEIAYDCRDPNYDIFIISAHGGKPRRLTADSMSDNVASWSGDGRWVYFSSDRSGNWQIWKIPATGGAPVQITTGGGFGGFESADGKFVYYAKTLARETSLWRVPVDGGEETEIFSGLKSGYNFRLSNKGVYFIDSPDHATFFFRFFDLHTKQVNTVREVNNTEGKGFAVAPGERWILFAASAFRGGDLTLIENLP